MKEFLFFLRNFQFLRVQKCKNSPRNRNLAQKKIFYAEYSITEIMALVYYITK